MRARNVVLVLAGLVAAGVFVVWGASASAPSPSPPSPPGPNPPEPNPPVLPRIGLSTRRVLLVGDSLAVGLGPRTRQRAGASGAIFSHSAEQGTTIGQWSRGRFESVVTTHRPEIILVSLGTNDAAMFDVSGVPARLRELLDSAGRHNARVYWIGPPTLPPRLRNAEVVRQMIRDTGVPYFESERVSFARAGDGIHAPASGYATWADAVWDWLEAMTP